jgi:hypothetical protein
LVLFCQKQKVHHMSESLPRGVRNNNPGNVRRGQPWEGLAPQQTDPAFCQFIDAQHGIRALALILNSYQAVDGCMTVQQMINRWAPPSDDNPTTAYVDFVAGRLGLAPDGQPVISDPAVMAAMVNAIIAQECANYAYPADVVAAGIALAGVCS